jgi:stress response protein YsnF
VGKRVTQKTRQVSDTVRREELRMENEGDVEVRKDNP